MLNAPTIVIVALLYLCLLFAIAYYGDWLPNTYYLKVAGRSGLAWAGAGNVKGFIATYATVMVLA